MSEKKPKKRKRRRFVGFECRGKPKYVPAPQEEAVARGDWIEDAAQPDEE